MKVIHISAGVRLGPQKLRRIWNEPSDPLSYFCPYWAVYGVDIHRRTNQLQAFVTRWERTTMVMEGAPHGILMETMNEEESARGGEPTIEMSTTERHMFVFQNDECHQPDIHVLRSTLPGLPGDDSFNIRASVSMRLDRSLVYKTLDFLSVPEHQSRGKNQMMSYIDVIGRCIN